MLCCYLLLINVFKCNLKELTTKSANSARGKRLVFRRMCNCAVFLCGIGQAVRGVSVSQRGRKQSSSSSPPPPFSLHCFFSVMGACFLSLVRGSSWLGCSLVPAMGELFSLGAGCQKWKPLDLPGTQPPLSDAVVKCSFHLRTLHSPCICNPPRDFPVF